MKKPLDHGDMVANIVATYGRASDAQREAGKAWYPMAGTIVRAIADATNSDEVKVAYALSALSPRNPWLWNVADAFAFASARAEGRTMPRATTFRRNQLAAWQALAKEGAPWSTAAPKVNAFVAAILGNPLSIVVDVWAYRVATETTVKAIGTKAYRQVAAAYAEAAANIGILPRDLQAITWLVARTEGTASTSHVMTYKAGTPEFVKDITK